MRATVAIAIHDVAPQTAPACATLIQLVRRLAGDIPLTLLVIPHMHRSVSVEHDESCRRLIDRSLEAGAEVALHGYCHLDGEARSPKLSVALARRFLTDGEAEFAALDGPSARRRIEQGLACVRRCGWPVRGFVPPAWQISDAAAAALREFPFEYLTRLGSVICLREGLAHRVQCLTFSARSRARRTLSPRWVRWQLSRSSAALHIRVALHPLDACHGELLQAWTEILIAVLDTREPVTKGALCQALISGSGALQVESTLPRVRGRPAGPFPPPRNGT